MSNIRSAPDTIFEGFPGLNPNATTPVVTQGGRLMSTGLHTDGLLWGSPQVLEKSSANLVLTRNGIGDWSLNRTAAGAETYYVRANLAALLMVRTGELYNLGLFGPASSATPAAPAKGIQVTDVFAVTNVGVASLTSATIRYGKVQYALPGAAAAAIVQSDILAATALTTLTAQAANAYLVQKQAVASPVLQVSDLAQYEIELSVVMANTGTIQIAGIGAHYNFNYT